jgi:hypothetical protein
LPMLKSGDSDLGVILRGLPSLSSCDGRVYCRDLIGESRT